MGDGDRISFAIPATHCLRCSDWAEKLSPLGTKALRLVVALASGFSVTTNEDELVESLTRELPEELLWEIYENFGNKLGLGTQETPAALAVSCRRWSSSSIPKSNISTTQLTQKLRKAIIQKWGTQPISKTTNCEFTYLVFDSSAWLEWTLLVPSPARKFATMDLPYPGCKRVEAWMLVHACIYGSELLNCRPKDSQILVLDPMCGKATYLVEAATHSLLSHGSAASFMGVDQSPEQLKDALLNVEATSCQDRIALVRGDAGDLNHIKDGTVSVVLSCPPFGRQFGRGMDLREMYQQWICEWHRVLNPERGRFALLVDVDHQQDALAAIRSQGDLHVLVVREPFRLGGLQATVIVAERSLSEMTGMPLSRFSWEGNGKKSRAEWIRLRTESLQTLVPYSK